MDIADYPTLSTFTTTDVFFTQIGGYKIYPDGVGQDPMHINTDGILELLESGAVTLAQLAEIKKDGDDRNKTAGVLSKLLVPPRLYGWYVGNCAFRATAGLPVTPLELKVLTHVVFAVLMYMCWRWKPHNVVQSLTQLAFRRKDEGLCAIMIQERTGSLLGVAVGECHAQTGVEGHIYDMASAWGWIYMMMIKRPTPSALTSLPTMERSCMCRAVPSTSSIRTSGIYHHSLVIGFPPSNIIVDVTNNCYFEVVLDDQFITDRDRTDPKQASGRGHLALRVRPKEGCEGRERASEPTFPKAEENIGGKGRQAFGLQMGHTTECPSTFLGGF